MPDAARLLALYGTTELPSEPRRLVAGRLSVELEGGNLRYLRVGGVEVLRAVSFLVRSRIWATLEPEIVGTDIVETDGRFRVTYRAVVRDGDARLDYAAQIEGSESALAFFCVATAATDFLTCRTGFVVLHPASVAGLPVRVEHADGGMTETAFPDLIDPAQPFSDVRALSHAAAPGLMATCRMEGDSFETEDQRNWTDASFKTYVRPLSRPWPYHLPRGSVSRQSVHARVDGRAAPRAAKPGPIRLGVGEAVGTMPPIGLGCTPAEARAALPFAARLAEAGFDALVARYDRGEGHDAAALAALRDLAARCGCAVELQVVVHSVAGYAAELLDAAAAARDAGLAPRAVAVSPAADLKSVPPGQPWPDCAPLDGLYAAARAAFPGVALGGGTFAHFPELNRKRPLAALLDFVTFATSPLVHAADDRSVMESLQSLQAVARSARAIAGGRPFVVGPSAIALRDNPYGPAPLDNPAGLRLAMAGQDPRQRGAFNAAWTLGYIAAFAAGGAARIAVSAPAGRCGVMDADGPYPVFRVIRACAALRGATLRALRCPEPAVLAGFVADTATGRQLWVANLGPAPAAVLPPDAAPVPLDGFEVACVTVAASAAASSGPAIAGGTSPG